MVIRAREGYDYWISLFFNSKIGIEYFEKQLKLIYHSGEGRVSRKSISNITIPDIKLMKITDNILSPNDPKTYVLGKDLQQQVLKDINLAINKGEFVSVMGSSGSGKSTLLYCISGMDQVNSGQIQFSTSDLTFMNEEALAALRLQKMGFIFQQNSLLKNLNILDNLIIPAFMLKIESRKTIVDRAKKLMNQMNTLTLADNDINQASVDNCNE